MISRRALLAAPALAVLPVPAARASFPNRPVIPARWEELGTVRLLSWNEETQTPAETLVRARVRRRPGYVTLDLCRNEKPAFRLVGEDQRAIFGIRRSAPTVREAFRRILADTRTLA